MIEFVDVEDAKARGGLRMVYVPRVPSPWGEAAKGILFAKSIPYVAVHLTPGDNPVTQWTGEQSGPVAMYEGESPRGGWAEILLLAERIAPKPCLIPEDPADRALLFGFAHEIAGEMGLGWCRRLAGIDDGISGSGRGFSEPIARYLGSKYGWTEGCGAAAQRRVVDLLGLLSSRLHSQRERGSDYYIGESLTAVDIYSAAFVALFAPLPEEHCPMPPAMREAFAAIDDQTAKALDPVLVEHRDRVYERHLELPLTL